VVGPNGSGKSNVIDALLFVFGKRAKQARRARPNLTGLSPASPQR
jgi:structural maintenance of chromosome 4